MRQDELVFLGMAPKPKTDQEKMNDPIEKQKKIQNERKANQLDNQNDYEAEKEDLIDQIKET